VPARSRIPSALALACLSAAVAAPAARAAWTPPLTVTSDSRSSNVRAAGNARGHEAFVWRITTKRIVRLRAQTGEVGYIRARMRLPHGRLGKAQTISTTHGIVTGAQIGLDDAGNATAVWTQAGAHLSIMAAYRPHGKRFGAPFEIGRSTHFNDALAQLAVGRFGDAVVAWNQGPHVQVRRRSATAQCSPKQTIRCFGKPLSLRAGGDQTVAVGPLGSAYVVWAAGVPGAEGFHTQPRMIVIRRSGRHGVEHFLAAPTDGDASEPSLAVRADGIAIVAWRASRPAGGEQNEAGAIKAVTSSPDAVASPVQTITTGLGDVPVVVVSRRGEASLAWDAFDLTPGAPDGPQVFAATAPAGVATFGVPAAISPADRFAGNPSLAVDAAGTTFLAHGAPAGSPSAPAEPGALSHLRPAGGVFGPPIALPAGFGGVSLVAAGAQVTAVSAGFEGHTLLSDWTP
jgi:hypothetical protein